MPPAGVKSARPAHRCTECGYASAKWVGRCPECQAWGTIQEFGSPATSLRAVSAGAVTAPARPIAEVELAGAKAVPTGIPEFDRVLGGGLVPGAVLLVAGELTVLVTVANPEDEQERGEAFDFHHEEEGQEEGNEDTARERESAGESAGDSGAGQSSD